MALVVKDRVKETTATTGIGTLTLAGAATGFQSFSSALSDADTTYYAIFESSTGAWEVGLGTFTLSGTTLSRDTILESSNAGSAINLTAGAADVFITQPAEKAVYLDASGNVSVPGTVNGRNIASDGTKLDGIEAGADVTDTANVTAAGALMDSELTNITAVKALDQGVATTDSPDFAALNVNGTVTADSGYFQGSNSFINDTMTLNFAAPNGQVAVKNSSGAPAANLYFYTTDTSGSTKLRQGISYNGDISFYEDTGTTPKFFWDASLERLGVGTSSPAQAIHAIAGSYTGLRLETSDALGASYIDFGGNSDPDVGGIQYFHTDNSMRFVSNAAERLRIDSSGRVGIGISSPSRTLSVVDATSDGSGGILVQNYLPTIELDDASGGGTSTIIKHDGTATIIENGGSERMRITSAGSVGIGTTNPAEKLDVSGVTLSSAVQEGYSALSGTTPSIDADTAGSFALTTSGNTTFTFAAVTSGRTVGFVLKLTAGGTHTITWPASVDWAGGTAPDAPASGETDVLVFYTVDGGTTWYGARSIDAAA